MDALRRCRDWLERLERGEKVVVNLRPETDPETEYVAFDRPRVLRVLARIIADLDGLAGFPSIAEEEVKKGGAEARRARHRRRLAEPDPPPKQLTVRESAGGPPRLAEASAVREELNKPGPGLHDGTIQSLVSAAWVAQKGAVADHKNLTFIYMTIMFSGPPM